MSFQAALPEFLFIYFICQTSTTVPRLPRSSLAELAEGPYIIVAMLGQELVFGAGLQLWNSSDTEDDTRREHIVSRP